MIQKISLYQCILYSILWFILFLYSMKLINDNVENYDNKIQHVAIALIAPPIYILSVILSKQKI